MGAALRLLAVSALLGAAVVWEESTAVRRRVLLRHTADAGRTLSPVVALSPPSGRGRRTSRRRPTAASW